MRGTQLYIPHYIVIENHNPIVCDYLLCCVQLSYFMVESMCG